jgi:predicted Zn-dependent peptidase
MAKVVDLLAASLDDLGEGRIERDEVERSKASLRADILLAADEPLSRLGRLGVDVLFRGSPRTTEELLADLDNVDVDAVRQAAHRVGTSDRQGVLVGPAPHGAVSALQKAVG